MIGRLRTHLRKQPIIALYFYFENLYFCSTDAFVLVSHDNLFLLNCRESNNRIINIIMNYAIFFCFKITILRKHYSLYTVAYSDTFSPKYLNKSYIWNLQLMTIPWFMGTKSLLIYSTSLQTTVSISYIFFEIYTYQKICPFVRALRDKK